jgi:spermidine/putrescine transport system permease protein
MNRTVAESKQGVLASIFGGRPMLLTVLVVLLFLFQWAPMILLTIFSFNDSRFLVSWQGLTLNWYREVIQDDLTLQALKVSLIVATTTIAISSVIGTMTAYAIYKYRFWGKEGLRAVLVLPLIMPSIVMGISLLLFFSRIIDVSLGYVSIITAHVVFSIPLVTFIVLARMQRIDWTLEEAAMDLGADRFTTLRRVTIPLLMPGIMAAAILNFPWSFNDFVITYFVAGVGTTTLPIRIYSMIKVRGVSPSINALGALIIFISVGLVIISLLLQQRRT